MEPLCVIYDLLIDGGCPWEFTRLMFEPRIVHFRTDEVIVEEGSAVEGVFCLHCGSVALTRRITAQRSYRTYILGAGDLVGIPAIMTDMIHGNGAVALEPVSACFISTERFRELVRYNPIITIHALRQMALRIDVTEHNADDAVWMG